MTQAELSFLIPLIELASSLADTEDVERPSMGLGEIAPDSALARDDEGLSGLWVSMVVNNSIAATLDHVVTLRDIVIRDAGTVTLNAPWTLLRAAVEASAVGVWVMESDERKTRRARALRVWHYDFSQRQKWEDDTKRTPPEGGKSGAARANEVLALATGLGIRPTQVTTQLNYADAVADAGAVIGWSRTEARARWREASGFAHGRTWPLLTLANPSDAQVIRGGVGVHLTLDENRLRPLAELTHDLLHWALVRYSELARPESVNDGT